MNKKPEKSNYLAWGLTAFLVVCACLLITFLIFNFSTVLKGISGFFRILTPIIDGLALAYLLTPVLNSVERNIFIPLFKKISGDKFESKKRLCRGISIFTTWLFVGFILYLFLMIVIPQLIISVQSIIFQFPAYINNLGNFFMNLLDENPDLESTFNSIYDNYSNEFYNYLQNNILPQLNEIIKTLSNGVISFIKGTFNLIIGIIISFYLMFSKELFAGQAKKIVYALFERKSANKIISGTRYAHSTFIGFFGGKIIDSIIIGVLTFIVLYIFNIPYAVLVSVIVGVTNVIPFFGPYIGAIPSTLLILMVNPLKALYFVILILIIQQLDGNVIGPKILGDSTGLSSFWVVFSITLFGGMFGVIGMIIGVPTFAVIYAFIRYKINRRLRHKELPQDTASYLKVGHIHTDGTFDEYAPAKGRSLLQILGLDKRKFKKAEFMADEENEEDEENNKSGESAKRSLPDDQIVNVTEADKATGTEADTVADIMTDTKESEETEP